MEQQLLPLLEVVFAPAHGAKAKQQAEAELRRLLRSQDALIWASTTLQRGQGDQRLLFAAAQVLEDAAARQAALCPQQQAALRQCLWHGVFASEQLPHFVRGKLIGALAHLACIEWPLAYPDFWNQLQGALSDLATLDRGLTLLAATIEQFQALALTTSAGLKGKILSHQVPDLQSRFRQLQPVVVSTLCSLLQGLAAGLSAAVVTNDQRRLSPVVKALQALRSTLYGLHSLTQLDGISSAALVNLLAEYALTLRLARPEHPGEEAALQVSAAAQDCICDLFTKHHEGAGSQQMLATLLPKLQELCDAVQQHWASRGQQFQTEDPALTAFVRLLVQLFSTQLSQADAMPELMRGALRLLTQVQALMQVRQSPVDVLLFAEVFHAVLSHLESFEDQLCDLGNDKLAAQHVQEASRALKGPVIAMAHLLLASLMGAAVAPGQPAPPVSLAALDATPGSGAAMDAWLQSVVSGGGVGLHAEEEAEEAAAGGEGEEEEGESEVLVPAASHHSPFQAESEVCVFTRHAESFLARAVGTFPSDLLPLILQQLEQSRAPFVQACEQLVRSAPATPAGPAVNAALHHMDVVLRVLARAAPTLPVSRAADGLTGTAPADQVLSGAHAVLAFTTLTQLAGMWLHAMQQLAAASWSADPFTPANARAGPSSVSMFVSVGARLHKCLGALTAMWLPQLMMAGAHDPSVAACLHRLLEALLASESQLLAALPGLPTWQGVLHRAAQAAAECLVSLSSIALASGMKPPGALLQAVASSSHLQALLTVGQQSLASSMLLPAKARRALFVCLSDLTLRSWASQPTASFDSAARAQAFESVAQPLCRCLRQAADGALQTAQLAGTAKRAAAAASSIVQSFSGSPKSVRSIAAGQLALPAMPSIAALVQLAATGWPGPGQQSSKLVARLLQLISSVLQALGTEVDTATIEQLLGGLVQALGAAGGDPTLESDLALIGMLCAALGGASTKHQALLMPALHFCMATWSKAGSQGQPTDADVHHVRASALAAILSLLRLRWRALVGGSARPAARGDGGQAAGWGAHPLAASIQHAANQAAPAGGSAEGAAAVSHALELLLQFFCGAAVGQAVVPSADVRLVLEELYELQVAVKLYSSPFFDPRARDRLLTALLAMLLSRLYTGAQDQLIDTLFSVAASNWSAFLLTFLPAFVEQHMAQLGPSERQALLALFGAGDLEAAAFERQALAFLNDALYLERCSL